MSENRFQFRERERIDGRYEILGAWACPSFQFRREARLYCRHRNTGKEHHEALALVEAAVERRKRSQTLPLPFPAERPN